VDLAGLERSIRAHGFLRLRCGECSHDRLLAFSCTRRGCNGAAMAFMALSPPRKA